jgi:hypothetical protein
MILRVPGEALLLRVAWIERARFPDERTEGCISPENGSCRNFLILKMSKSEQKSSGRDARHQYPCGDNEKDEPRCRYE